MTKLNDDEEALRMHARQDRTAYARGGAKAKQDRRLGRQLGQGAQPNPPNPIQF
jgi:hypothetical protein